MKPTFQTVVMIVFIVAFIAAVLAFSGILGGGSSSSQTATIGGRVSIWGILPNEQMQLYIENFNTNDTGYILSYTEHRPEDFYQDLVNALADNTPPDLVILNSELLAQFKSRLYTTSYEVYNERTFRDTNVDGAQLFLDADGISAFPLLVDPLVVYYNKDILAGQNFVVPPTTWTNVQRSIALFTRRDAKNGVSQTTLALGGSQNVDHARDILSTLFLQTGNPIVAYDPITRRNRVALNESNVAGEVAPTTQALSFYTSFANPTSTNYSWNSSLPSSLQMFLAGKSAFYIGRASELFTIQQQNPNLNFDVSSMFQSDVSTRAITFGSFVAIGVLKNTPNINAAYPAATMLSSKENIDAFSKAFSLPPARRDLLLIQQTNPYVSIFFKSALSTFSWQDPNNSSTEQIFRDMIESVNSGRTDASTAISNASRDMQNSIR